MRACNLLQFNVVRQTGDEPRSPHRRVGLSYPSCELQVGRGDQPDGHSGSGWARSEYGLESRPDSANGKRLLSRLGFQQFAPAGPSLAATSCGLVCFLFSVREPMLWMSFDPAVW